MISLAPVYNSLTGDVYELPAVTVKAVHGFPVPAGFGGKGRLKPRLSTRLDYTSRRSTRRKRPAENSKGVPCMLPFEQHSKTKIKEEKNIEIKKTTKIHFNFIYPGQCRICAVHVPSVYVQCMYVTQVCAGTLCRRFIPPVLPVYVFKCVPVPVPDASASSVRHEYRYQKLR